jgi:RHS repeat-associated protein
MDSFNRLAAPLCAVLLLVSVRVSAQQTLQQEYSSLIRAQGAVMPVGEGEFGDKLNHYTGQLEFVQTDLSIPGIGELPMAITRRFVPNSQQPDTERTLAFGDWELELPRIEATLATATGWTVQGAQPNNRCSSFGPPPDLNITVGTPPNQVQSIVSSDEYSSGARLLLAGQAVELLKRPAAITVKPQDSFAYPVISKDWWMLRCIELDPGVGSGEGFVAVAPNGTRYTFSRLVTRPKAGVTRPAGIGTLGPDTGRRANPLVDPPPISIPRFEGRLQITRMQDRFGNSVDFSYQGTSGDAAWRLNTISASDGRSISFDYCNSARRICRVISDAGTWQYGYASNGSLSTVTRPDGTQWLLNLDPLYSTTVSYPATAGCSNLPAPDNAADLTGTIRSPTGGLASYTMGIQRHGRSNAPNTCFNTGPNGISYAAVQPKEWDSFSLKQRSVSGPRLPSSVTHSFTYGGCAVGSGCSTTRTTNVTGPRGFVDSYVFGTRYGDDEGLLLSVNRAISLSVTALDYQAAAGQSYPATMGNALQPRGDLARLATKRPTNQADTTLQGRVFKGEPSNFDEYGFARTYTRGSKIETVTYNHATVSWNIGAVKSIRDSGGVFELERTFNTLGQVASVRLFGKPYRNYSYYGNGELLSVTDADNHTTSYSDYYRGIPRLTTHPDGSTEEVTVDPRGLITSYTNEAGHTTSFQYDLNQRLTQVTYPSGDGFSATTIGYNVNPSSGYTVTQTTGSLSVRTEHDALFRPTLTRISNGSSSRYIRRTFDNDGNLTFESQPSAFATAPAGTFYVYDTLGRLTQRTEPNNLITNWAYTSDFGLLITDPREVKTRISFKTNDQPTYDWPVSIEGPTSTLNGTDVTTITRNTWGDATLIQRSFGGSRSFSYNAARELVVSSSLEEGTATYSYNSRGLLSSYTHGDSSRTTYTHDSRGRLTQIDYPDATPDLTQSYTPDGLLSTINNGLISRSFSYNASRLLTSETLSVTGGPSFTLGRGYSATQALSSLTYPDASTISYAPDAYGEPTTATPFASNVSHHHNGAVAAFTYGNGITHTLTQDVLDRPLRSTDAGVLDHSFGYDSVSNLTSITDHRPGAIESKTMAYNARSMLTSATAPNAWGTATFTYTLGGDNLTTMNVGANTATFALDTALRLERVTRPGNDVTTFGYDARGNMTRRGSQILTFDRANHLTGISGGDSYQYDGLDQRTISTSPDGRKNYSFYSSDGELIAEVEVPRPNPADLVFRSGFDPDPNTTTQYYYLSGSLLAKRIKIGLGPSATIQTVYLHTDHLGGTSKETNAAGQLIKTERYEPFGKDADGSAPTGLGYGGHYQDASGLIYMGARYYDPLTGRFISPDPVGTSTFDGSNFNRYWYADNNPYTNYDPDGRSAWTKLAKLARNGGNVAETFSGVISDYKIVASPSSGMGTKLLHSLSIASEISPLSAGDIKDIGKAVFKKADAAPSIPIGTATVTNRADAKVSTLTLGPFTVEAIPARSTSQKFIPTERSQINKLGETFGCHTCGVTTPGTASGNFVPDHQPVSKLSPPNTPQVLVPHCKKCSLRQGGEANAALAKTRAKKDDQVL